MKYFLVIVFLVSGLVAHAVPSVVRLEAQTSSTSRQEDKRYETSWGSYDKSIYRSRFVTMSATAPRAMKVKIFCYWIGKDPVDKGKEVITKTEEEEVTLEARVPAKLEFGELFVEDAARYVMLDIKTAGGMKYYGWVIRVADENGRTLAVQGARPPMVDLVVALLKE